MTHSGVGADNDRWFRPLGTLDDGEFQVAVTPTATNPVEGWQHTTLRVAWLGENGYVEHDTGDEELVVVPLSGSLTVEISDSEPIELDGRVSVFDGPSDTAYLPRQRTVTVRNSGTGPARVALCGARASTDREPRRIARRARHRLRPRHR